MRAERPRWWPLVLALVAYAVGLVAVWQLWDAPSRQDRVIATTSLSGLLAAAFLGWLLLLSRLPWKTRLFGLAALALLGLALSQAVTVTGVSGDVIPILAWRWSAKADELLERHPRGAIVAGALGPTGSRDFPQFLGPHRNATVPEVALARDWSAGPELVWRHPVGAGWSGFAVVGNRAVTLEQRGPEELVVCYDLATGDVLWSHADATRLESVIAGDGPRATPAIARGRVHAVGATGRLNVLELETGAVVWSKDILEDNGVEGLPEYGVAASPLVRGDTVVVVANGARAGSLVAYDRHTGAKLWNAGDDRGRYSSPTLVTLAGREQILLFYEGALRGHDPETGTVLWEFPWPAETEEASQPLPIGDDRVLLSSGYGIGSKLIRVTATKGGPWRAELVWESLGLKAKFTNVVLHEDHVYGLDDGILVCLDPADGSRKWKAGRYGHGHVLLVADLLLVLTEGGEVVLVEPRPDEHVELGRFQALEGKTWNTPALAGPYLLVRNATEAACWQLPLAEDVRSRTGSGSAPPSP
jgi:outer membrane protein assembly factor BamB